MNFEDTFLLEIHKSMVHMVHAVCHDEINYSQYSLYACKIAYFMPL
jgi:hypothetical protein